MVRHAVRAASALIALLGAVLSVLLAGVDQRDFPMGIDRTFRLDFSRATISKAHVVSDLDAFATRHGALLAKSVADPADYLHSHSLYVFGSTPRVPYGPIDWFDPALRGNVEPSSKLDEANITGTYHLADCRSDCETDLLEWARGAGVVVEDWQGRAPIRMFFRYLGNTGASLALVGALLLLISSTIAWYSSRAKARALRLLGGVPSRRIQFDDLLALARMVVFWSASATVVATLAIVITRGASAILPFMRFCLPIVGGILVVSLILSILISICTEPSVDMIASRVPPLREFRRLGAITQVTALAVSVVALPSTLTSMDQARTSMRESSQWAKAKNAVALRMSGSEDEGVLNTWYPKVETMLLRAQTEGILGFSYTVNGATNGMSDGTGPYDRILLANPLFLRTMGIEDSLTPVSPDSVPSTVQQAMAGSLELWTRNGTSSVDGISVYESSGRIPSIDGVDGSLTYSSRALVFVVDSPATAFSTSALLYPALTTGNLFFTDGGRVSTLIHEAGMDEIILSVDRLADVALDRSQQMREEIRNHLIAIILLVSVVIIASIQTANIWTQNNAKRIFALRTYGKSRWNIIKRRISWEIILACFIAFLSIYIGPIVTKAPISQFIRVLPMILSIYVCGIICAYYRAVSRSFFHSLHRS